MGVYAVVKNVRDLGLPVAEADDATVELGISSAEDLVDRVTSDRFAKEDARTFLLSGKGGRLLFLPRRARTITEVTVFGSLLSVNNYVVHRSLNAAGDDFAEDGDFDAIELAATSDPWPAGVWQGKPPVSVKGDFSWAAVPRRITDATARLAQRSLKKSSVPPDVIRWTTETATFDRGATDVIARSLTGYLDIDSLLARYVRSPVLIGSH